LLRCRPCFFGVVAQQRVLTAAQRRLEKADATLKTRATARAAQGLVSTNDATRAEVERSTSLQIVANAQSGLEQSRVTLGYALDASDRRRAQAPEVSLVPGDIDVARLSDRAVSQRPTSHRAGCRRGRFCPRRRSPGCGSCRRSMRKAQARVAIRRWPVTATSIRHSR